MLYRLYLKCKNIAASRKATIILIPTKLFTFTSKLDIIRVMRDYEFYYTQDGSIGLYSYADNDVYHSKFGAVTESWEKFILPSGLDNLINTKPNIKVLDVCYGIGYNTKSLMSFVINTNKKFLKRENILKKILKKFFKKNKKEILDNTNIETIDSNKIKLKNEILSEPIETNKEEIISNYDIDCLEINSELVKLSPLLKTIITPQEIFTRICPRIFDCFDSYWKIRKFLSKIALKFAPKNKQEISELLELKFNNEYEQIDSNYRIHDFVNYILIDSLVYKYGKNYIDKSIKKILKEKGVKRFIAPSLLKYAKFKQDSRYKFISKLDLLAYLHNIYYDHLSNRYKRAKFKETEKLFKLNFYVEDARKAILQIEKQYDVIFLDAFTFSKAPELWTVEFMAELYNRLSPRGILMTYSNSALVRNTFLENKFYVGKIYDEKSGKYIGTVAAKDKSLIEHPLSNYEIGLCNTRAGIPYHDPTLSADKKEILKRREQEFKTSELMTSSQYMRSRTSKTGEDDE